LHLHAQRHLLYVVSAVGATSYHCHSTDGSAQNSPQQRDAFFTSPAIYTSSSSAAVCHPSDLYLMPTATNPLLLVIAIPTMVLTTITPHSLGITKKPHLTQQ
jgi:hypothetical protein